MQCNGPKFVSYIFFFQYNKYTIINNFNVLTSVMIWSRSLCISSINTLKSVSKCTSIFPFYNIAHSPTKLRNFHTLQSLLVYTYNLGKTGTNFMWTRYLFMVGRRVFKRKVFQNIIMTSLAILFQRSRLFNQYKCILSTII